MTAVARLIRELEELIDRGSQERCAATLRRVTDLFLNGASHFNPNQIELFDIVLARLVTAIETRARAELSDRLADVPQAPSGVVRTLAHDEIVVARPVLERSMKLTDQDLVSVALSRGRDHMLAMAERRNLSETVTDVLITHGDRVVTHAVVGNRTARFSNHGLDRLVEKATADEALQALLQQRIDMPETHLRQLVDLAKETARKRLAKTMPSVEDSTLVSAVEASATAVRAKVEPSLTPEPIKHDYSDALSTIERRVETADITELDVAEFAGKQEFEETVCAISHLVQISLASVQRLFDDPDTDLLLILAKSQNWAWSTVRTLIRLRTVVGVQVGDVERVKDSYDRLNQQTAHRVLRFLQAREAKQSITGYRARAV